MTGRVRPRATLLATLTTAALLLAACKGGTDTPAGGPGSSSPPAPATAATSASRPAPASATPARSDPAVARSAAERAVTKLTGRSTSYSVAAVNTSTGAQFSLGRRSGLWTASVYKVLVLEVLLLQRQDDGSGLSDSEAALAETMIENSDDPSAYQLFLDLGGNPGLRTGIRRLGLKHTVPGTSDPTFTTTGAVDCVTLLRDLTSAKSPLDATSRGYILGLMRSVEHDQRWGVGAVADKGTTFAIKNGWLSVDNTNGGDEDDDGLWIANSIGVVTVHHQQVLMAVLSEHNNDFDTGVRLVEGLARAAAPAVSG